MYGACHAPCGAAPCFGNSLGGAGGSCVLCVLWAGLSCVKSKEDTRSRRAVKLERARYALHGGCSPKI